MKATSVLLVLLSTLLVAGCGLSPYPKKNPHPNLYLGVQKVLEENSGK
jgi:hypothetical protein